jgi:hypothetical protein
MALTGSAQKLRDWAARLLTPMTLITASTALRIVARMIGAERLRTRQASSPIVWSRT